MAYKRELRSILWLSVCAWIVSGSVLASCQDSEKPVSVTVCQLKNDPPAYNHKLVEVSGFVSHAFEDFSISDPACSSWPDVWLEYGGTSKSGTMYCCGVTADRQRAKEMIVENIPIPLVADEQFRRFDKAIQPPFRSGENGAIIRATLVGRYFSGERIQYRKDKPWGGYGHMGCCTLLALQKVTAVDTDDRLELDNGAEADQPDVDKTGCGYRILLPLGESPAIVQWQKDADEGKHDWAFDDPVRVAGETLGALGKTNVPVRLKLTREAPGRKVYEWRPSRKGARYMVVVSRSYLASFYAHNPNRVAWAAIAAYESCGP